MEIIHLQRCHLYLTVSVLTHPDPVHDEDLAGGMKNKMGIQTDVLPSFHPMTLLVPIDPSDVTRGRILMQMNHCHLAQLPIALHCNVHSGRLLTFLWTRVRIDGTRKDQRIDIPIMILASLPTDLLHSGSDGQLMIEDPMTYLLDDRFPLDLTTETIPDTTDPNPMKDRPELIVLADVLNDQVTWIDLNDVLHRQEITIATDAELRGNRRLWATNGGRALMKASIRRTSMLRTIVLQHLRKNCRQNPSMNWSKW